jgi:Protein of unknown function (DUF3106)
MMRNIAIGLAAATIAIGSSTLSASALSGQESGISKGNMSGSVKSHRFGPRTYGFNDEERGRQLTPLQRERIKGIMRERFSELTPLQRERIRGIVRERYAELTPLQRERIRGIVRERFAELTPLQRERISKFVLERLNRHGPYGRL